MRLVHDDFNDARLYSHGVCAKEESLRAMDSADILHQETVGRELEVTSCVDGVHMPHSRHYVGLAFDIRVRYLVNIQTFAAVLSVRLGKDYDVVREKTHIHVEYDPTR